MGSREEEIIVKGLAQLHLDKNKMINKG